MEKINLSSIKRESIKAIFDAVSSKDQISRSDVSARTGLSLMTVGKVIDALIERGVLCQTKEVKPSSGRRAGLVKLNTSSFFIIIDLTSRNFVLSAVDIGFKVIDRMMYEYNSDFYFEENLYIFLKNIKIYLRRRFDRELCSGVGISLPGAYNPMIDRVNSARIPELNNVNICEAVSDILDLQICFVEQDIKLAAMSNVTAVQDYQKKVISYIYIGENIGSALISEGKLLYGANSIAGRICSLPLGSSSTVGTVIENSQNPEDITDALTLVLYTICCIADPHEIIIECDRYKLSADYLKMLTNRLTSNSAFTSQNIPKIVLSKGNMKHAHRGLVMQLRDKWLDSII